MARYSIDPQKKRVPIPASVSKEVVDKIGKLKCKEIAENAINKEYNKVQTKH